MSSSSIDSVKWVFRYRVHFSSDIWKCKNASQHQFRFVLLSRMLNKEKYTDTEIGTSMNGCTEPRGNILLTKKINERTHEWSRGKRKVVKSNSPRNRRLNVKRNTKMNRTIALKWIKWSRLEHTTGVQCVD